MARPGKYSPEVRERFVRLCQEHTGEHGSQCGGRPLFVGMNSAVAPFEAITLASSGLWERGIRLGGNGTQNHRSRKRDAWRRRKRWLLFPPLLSHPLLADGTEIGNPGSADPPGHKDDSDNHEYSQSQPQHVSCSPLKSPKPTAETETAHLISVLHSNRFRKCADSVTFGFGHWRAACRKSSSMGCRRSAQGKTVRRPIDNSTLIRSWFGSQCMRY